MKSLLEHSDNQKQSSKIHTSGKGFERWLVWDTPSVTEQISPGTIGIVISQLNNREKKVSCKIINQPMSYDMCNISPLTCCEIATNPDLPR